MYGNLSRVWPGMRAFAVLHWRGEASLGRTVFSAFFALFAPTLSVVGLAFVWEACWGYSDALWHLAYVGMFLVAPTSVWWAVGVHNKFLKLLAAGNALLGVVAFGVFLLAGALSIFFVKATAREVGEWLLPPYDAHAECRSDRKSWVSRPMNVRYVPELNRIIASGSIGWDSARALEAALQAHPQVHLLQLDSPGGLVHERDLLIRVVERHRLDTLVQGWCASACTGVFLAGQRRYVTPNAQFGYHRAGYCGMRPDVPPQVTDLIAASQLREHGIREEFVKAVLATPYESILSLSSLQLKRLGVATHWWSERPDEYNHAGPA